MDRTAALIMVAVVTAGVAACTGTEASTDAAPVVEATADPLVIRHTGLGDIEFGDTRAELEREHGLVQEPGDCAPKLPSYPSVSPVFEEDRLVLLWADPPVRTAAGLMVGSLVEEVHRAHPDAEALPAPPESFRFDGVLSTVDDRAYLFLHDQEQVQKVIVGYDEPARRVLEENFGTC